MWESRSRWSTRQQAKAKAPTGCIENVATHCISWVKTDVDQNDEQGLILRAIAKFPQSSAELQDMLKWGSWNNGMTLTVCRTIIIKPQGGGRCGIKLVNMEVQIQSLYQQLCHQCLRGSTLRMLLAEDGADRNRYPTCTSSCCPN